MEAFGERAGGRHPRRDPGLLQETRRLLDDREPGDGYRLVGWLDDMPGAIAAADLVVSRSGRSVFELAAIGRPSILVPYPHATADHQAKNARWLAEAGAAVVLPDDECTGDHLRGLVERCSRTATASRPWPRRPARRGGPRPADRIAEEALSIARRPRLCTTQPRRPGRPGLRRRRRRTG